MNMKELEAALGTQQTVIEAMQKAMIQMQADLGKAQDDLKAVMKDVFQDHEILNGVITDVDKVLALTNDDSPMNVELRSIRNDLELVTAKVEGRNKSAPVKRNMTDADALAVLTGEYKDMSHKEAAEKIGLTYAQVYSCRGEFTFKHVHKDLRDAKWINPWAK